MENIIGIAVATIYIGIILVTSKFLEKKGEEASRKYIHIMLANVWIIYYFLIKDLWAAVILPAAFVVINSLSYKFNLIKTMEREQNDGLGTVYYAISILLISIFAYTFGNPMIGMAGMLIMGYGDGFAAIVGKKVKSKEYKVGNTTKSIAGSATMFIFSLVISCVVFYLLGTQYFVLKAFEIALLATFLEAVSIKGLDNITVPIIVTFITYLWI